MKHYSAALTNGIASIFFLYFISMEIDDDVVVGRHIRVGSFIPTHTTQYI